MHTAVAKALIELTVGEASSDYPYTLYLRFGPYQPAQFVLAGLVALMGPVAGAKTALSLYALAMVLSVGYLVGRVNPDARWERLVGVPLALNYFYHFGFWPYIASLPLAILAVALSLKPRQTKRLLVGGVLLRLGVFLFHPITALTLGIVDIAVVLLDIRDRQRWRNPLDWQWKSMLVLWSAAVVITVLYLLTSSMPSRVTQWATLFEQLKGIPRPFYLSPQWWDGLLPFLGWFLLSGAALLLLVKRGRWPGLWIAGALLIAFGLVFPREGFQGGSLFSERFVFFGIVLMSAVWTVPQLRLRNWIIAWIVVSTAMNVGRGHSLWYEYNQSFDGALTAAKDYSDAVYVQAQFDTMDGRPTHVFGRHLGVWAWCLNRAYDSHNVVANLRTYGPVKHRLESIHQAVQHTGPVIEFVYHPYSTRGVEIPSGSDLLYQDSITTLYRVQ